MYSVTLPSGLECELREMTGVEEELLLNPRLIKSAESTTQALRNCLQRIGDNTNVTMKDVLDLLSGDIEVLIYKMRQISLGDEFILTLICPYCRTANQVTINIDALPIIPYPAERSFTVTLPESQRVVTFGHLDGHQQKRLLSLPEPNSSLAMLIRIREIDGQPPNKKTLQEMPMSDRQFLRAAMADVDGGLDTSLTVDCQQCFTTIETSQATTPNFYHDFFFPHRR